MNTKSIERNVLASLNIEGLAPSKTGIKITRDYLNKIITSNEAISRIKNYWMSEYNKIKSGKVE